MSADVLMRVCTTCSVRYSWGLGGAVAGGRCPKTCCRSSPELAVVAAGDGQH